MPMSCFSCRCHVVHQLVYGKYAPRQCRNRRLLKQVKPEEIELVRRDYSANGGWESFLAYEDPRQDILVGLLRLRKVSGAAKSRQPELQGRCSIVRELHVYGTAVAVSARDATKQQHQVSLHRVCSITAQLPFVLKLSVRLVMFCMLPLACINKSWVQNRK